MNEQNMEQMNFIEAQRNRKVYEYFGTVTEVTKTKEASGVLHLELKLEEVKDYCKSPIVIHAYAGLAEYIDQMIKADCAERRIDATWCYGRDMILRRIVIKNRLGQFVKIVAAQRPMDEETIIFGSASFLTTERLAVMNQAEIIRWCSWASQYGAA